jgi:hypothetical protein
MRATDVAVELLADRALPTPRKRRVERGLASAVESWCFPIGWGDTSPSTEGRALAVTPPLYVGRRCIRRNLPKRPADAKDVVKAEDMFSTATATAADDSVRKRPASIKQFDPALANWAGGRVPREDDLTRPVSGLGPMFQCHVVLR